MQWSIQTQVLVWNAIYSLFTKPVGDHIEMTSQWFSISRDLGLQMKLRKTVTPPMWLGPNHIWFGSFHHVLPSVIRLIRLSLHGWWCLSLHLPIWFHQDVEDYACTGLQATGYLYLSLETTAVDLPDRLIELGDVLIKIEDSICDLQIVGSHFWPILLTCQLSCPSSYTLPWSLPSWECKFPFWFAQEALLRFQNERSGLGSMFTYSR